VLDVGVWESPFDAIEPLLGTEGAMVDLERVVQADTLLGQQLDDIVEGVVPDVEITRHTLDLNEALESATLSGIKLSEDSVKKRVSRHVAFSFSLRFKQEAILRDSGLDHFAIVVNNVVAHAVLNVKADNIARHVGHLDVDVDVEFIARVASLDEHVTRGRWLEVSAELTHREQHEQNCARHRH